LLAYSQDVIDRLKTMPLGETPLERLLAQLRDQASDICCGDWVSAVILKITKRAVGPFDAGRRPGLRQVAESGYETLSVMTDCQPS
jgi:hypothetical protein